MSQPAGRRKIPRLSKSSFNAGLQCLKRLYLTEAMVRLVKVLG